MASSRCCVGGLAGRRGETLAAGGGCIGSTPTLAGEVMSVSDLRLKSRDAALVGPAASHSVDTGSLWSGSWRACR